MDVPSKMTEEEPCKEHTSATQPNPADLDRSDDEADNRDSAQHQDCVRDEFVFSNPSSRSSLAFDETVHCLVFIVNTNPLVPSGFGYRKTETAARINYHGRGFAINEAQQLPWEGFSLRENAALF